MTLTAAPPAPERPVSGTLLDELSAARRKPIACGKALIVVAHPDDETIALGGHLARLKGIRILHVTDGAPRDPTDARASGFAAQGEYAAARRLELIAALEQAGIGPEALYSLGVADQSAAFRMPLLTMRLMGVIRQHGIETLLTHAYEGGHPDHDATAFVCHAACALLRREGAFAPAIIEFPLYHLRGKQMIVQEFSPFPKVECRACSIELHPDDLDAKLRMLAAYATQARTLVAFRSKLEHLRETPGYNFGELPNNGQLLYDHYEWGLKADGWLRLSREASAALDLPPWP